MNAIYLYCRPGFENECAAEIQEKAGWNEIYGFIKLKKNQGLVEFHVYDASQVDVLMQKLPLTRLIFTRQWFAAIGEPLELPEYNRVEAICEALGDEFHYEDLRVETLDTNDGKALSKFSRKLSVPLRQALRKQGVLAAKEQAEHTRGATNLHALFFSGQLVQLGYSYIANSSIHPMGIARLKFPSKAPSRSTLKLDEAFLYFIPRDEWDTRLASGLNAVDLGSAPGGWTYQLVRRGMMVKAVDNGPMADSLMETGQVKHYQLDGFKFRPSKKNNYWLVCDMIENSTRVAKLMASWIVDGDCKEAIFNLKLKPGKNRYQQVMKNLAQIKDVLSDNDVWYEMYAKHLYYDREEVTVHVRVLNQR
ncbi:23S rRNA (cytidine(2498)-2'-O)-methyltransferase RlmM [Thalassotalea ponticola]|uniref:23S rRNA (cytidine(2498)-2'-O)-methyltransferase RlmM n=1 Tax=Thalassotalea ponticola TaxID=1523392 RepID=UPI0025B3180D|nr:23S rRNA (cytidine(2498)-2'-O)-methyltransferase RlmM [Thalassotalea ponticola]MDN3651553.1 23S rRNA (cytidine(2498)-2'-O)-methyltransferase RlmM [Thalassotalea ponticola]